MENQPNQPAKKGFVLLLGVIIGLLVGLLVAFVLVQKLDLKSPQEVKVLPMPSTPAGKDTVYQYIVHQYDRIPGDEVVYPDSDSLSADSAFVEDYSMDYMLDDDDYQAHNWKEETNVTSEKLISKYEAPVLYFDANRNAVAAAANAPKLMEVQFWSTPFQNKIVYQFDGNVLKIKGLKPNEVYLIHYNKHYYLQNDKHVYQIQPSSEYMRLVEIHDVSFF
ncbi:MAG: hypothetical protein PUB29_07485 [Bacteroidales bacterium]|nr:hypothetical protein [Bacteroidales bacterium]